MKVTIRDVVESDLETFFEHQRDPEAVAMAVFESRPREAFFTHWRTKVLPNPQGKSQTIVVDGEVAGSITAWVSGETLMLGYWVGRAFWGRGVATEGLAQFLRVDLRRPLEAYVAVANVGSMRVLEKCGFQRVGREVNPGDGVEEVVFRLP